MPGGGKNCLSGKKTPRRGSAGKPRRGVMADRGLGQMRERASSSATRVKSPWSWRMEAGTWGVTGPKKASRMAWALAAPLATIRTFRACMMSRTPMVRAWVGTSSRLEKKRRLACRVLSVSSTWWVPREKASQAR